MCVQQMHRNNINGEHVDEYKQLLAMLTAFQARLDTVCVRMFTVVYGAGVARNAVDS
jgi:hypothetical protein